MIKLVVNNDRARYCGIARNYPSYERDRLLADRALKALTRDLVDLKIPKECDMQYRPSLKLKKKDYEFFKLRNRRFQGPSQP